MGSSKNFGFGLHNLRRGLQTFALVYPFITIFQPFNGLETIKKILPRSLLNTPLIFKKGVAPLIHILDYFSAQTGLSIELINDNSLGLIQWRRGFLEQ